MANTWAEMNGDEDDEAALRRAIAHSLGQDVPEVKSVEMNGDDDDEADLRRAIALSLGQVVPEAETADSALPSAASPAGQPPVQAEMTDRIASNSMSALGLDRQKMEEERLARSRKRRADTSPSRPADHYSQGPSSQRLRTANSALAERPQPSAQGANAGLNAEPHNSAQEIAGVPKASSSGRPAYPKGIVLRTWARGSPRDSDNDITIEEVLQKEDLQLAVLSSFQWDQEWLMKKLDLRRTKVLMIAYEPDDTQRAALRSSVPGDVIRFVFPPMAGGAMHSKLQLLKYKNSLRIVIPTGNLVGYDWGETGTMENMVFLIDLPLIRDPAKQAANKSLTLFGEELCFFLHAQGMDDKMINSLRKYDFSETARYGFVHTVAGFHIGPELSQRTGYCGLGRTVTALGLDTARDIQLDYVCSSLGAVKVDLLIALYNACRGESGTRESEVRAGKSKKSRGTATSDFDQIDLSRVRVYFPSRDTILRSQGGRNSAGTISFQSRWWEADSFPRQVLRDCQNVRSGILMHSKIMFVRRDPDASGGWAYVGSHNLSESAWGRLGKDKSGKPKFHARNWECGVVMPATASPSTAGKETARETRGAPGEFAMFCGSMPIPMELPALPYLGTERRPWFANEA